jgi:beta-galactosidase
MPTSTFARSALLLACLAGLRAADDAIWIEGEQPSGGKVEAPSTVNAPERADYLSGGKWLTISVPEKDVEQVIPEGGLQVAWDFQAAKDGHYQVWERYGMESIRSPWSWRIDDGAWQDIPGAPDQPYVDLMDPGFWVELAWTKLGEADLKAGAHKIAVRVQRQYDDKKKPKNVWHVVDCFCIAPSFSPNGKHRPGEEWQTDKDKEAAATVFEVPAAKGDDRVAAPLSGLWQVARWDEFQPADRTGADQELPKADTLFWSGFKVPGSKYDVRPDLSMAHRLIYRTQVKVPAEQAGRSFVLHFPIVNMIASVSVNGQFCGFTRGMMADWYCDITKAVKAGGANDLEVCIKDTFYALSPKKSGSSWSRLAITPHGWLGQNWVSADMDFPVGSVPQSGILEPPELLVCGAAYASDVFAKPSVAKKALALDVTLANPTAAEVTAKLEVSVEPAGGGKAEKTFAPQDVKIPAGGEQLVALSEGWDDPKLWWPDSPSLYEVVTRLTVAGKPVDVKRTTFGFREWGWSTDQFTLNGIPWHFHADCSESGSTPEQKLAYLKGHDQNMVRMWSWKWWGMSQQAALDFFDKNGMAIRHTGIFDGEGANYLHKLNDPELFKNWTVQLQAWCKAERNHPSLLIWSIENEITFINSRNLGLMNAVEPMVAEGGKAVMAMDPTRPVMVDGGRCLKNEDLPVNGCHYDEASWSLYPEEAYTYELAYKSHQVPWNGWGPSPWRLVPNRPVFHGEAYYLNGYRPGELSQWGGEEAFTGWLGARRGAGLFAKILSEGYRWRGIAAYHFWLGEGQVEPYYNSWKPVIALVREWNWTFAGGQKVERSLKLLNDTHDDSPIELTWEATLAGKKLAGETKAWTVAPGTAVELAAAFTLPAVKERTGGEFTLVCKRGGKEIFKDVKPLYAIDVDGAAKPSFKAGELAVLDPKGVVTERLKKRGIAFTEIKSADDIPASARVVVVGPDALDPRSATGNQWMAVAARGGRVLVLDQADPLQSAAVPADMTPSGKAGRVAFSENLTHPIFASLDQPDFFTWGKDEQVYRGIYTKPTKGGTSLVHCDASLAYSAMVESRINDGIMVMCQLVVGSKLATEPVAQRLFDNLLAYCADYKPIRKTTAVVFDESTPRGKVLAESGLVYDKASDPLAAIKSGKAEIVIFDATPANLKALVGDLKAVQDFTKKGGWLFAWGLTPDGLADFNKVVGVEHLIRPFRRERVTLPGVRDPLLSGLTMRDVVMESGKQIASWSGQRYVSSDSYSYVVDYDDIAPFLTYPDWRYFNPGDKKEPDPDKDPYNLVNGFTQADDWRYIFQLPAKEPFLNWDVTLPREEQPTQLDIINNGNYKLLDRIELTYDGDKDHPVVIAIKPEKDTLQSFALPERKVTKIHVNLASWEEKQAAPVIGIDNWWIKVKRSPDFYAKVKPLLNIGALMKYQQGKGGVVLCELNVPEHEENPENGPKRRTLVGTLLRNIGAVFSGGKTIVAGANLSYQPLALNELCNQFLTKDKGWFEEEKQDLGKFPVGDNRFAGVAYQVRDFKTSPLPCAISLEGAKTKSPLPPEVKGIPVKAKADALFFLHTARITGKWQPPKDGDKTPPPVWEYVVHYADGKDEVVPVRYDQGVADWTQKQPKGLADAVVAWAAPFGDQPGGEQAVVYQMQWTNPRPETAIETIDVRYDEKIKHSLGIPVILAITTATEGAKK